MVQFTRVRFFAFQPRYSPDMNESYTVTFSVFQNASFESRLEFLISTFLYNSNFDEYMKQKAPIADKIKEIKRKIENECW